MAINLLEKVYIFIPREYKDVLLEDLQKAKLVHIEKDLKSEIEEKPVEVVPDISDLELKISQAEYVIEYLKKYEKKKTLKEHLEGPPPAITYQEFLELSKKVDLEKIYNEVYRLAHRQKELASEETDCQLKIARLAPYLHIQVPFSQIKDTKHVKMRIGSIPEEAFKAFHIELEDITRAYTIEKIKEGHKGQTFFFIAYHKEFYEEIEKILAKHNFKEEDLSIEGIPQEEMMRLQKRLNEIEAEKLGLIKESTVLADWIDRVRLLYDYLVSVRDRKKAEAYMYETEKVAVLKGWVRKTDKDILEERIKRVTSQYDIVYKEPEEGENVPVEMINSDFISPMEFVTTLYGIPRYDEYDPTAAIFFFFVFFFAICLTDFGYGLMLLVLTLILMKYIGKTKLLKVLLYSSIVTLVVGFLAGGFWGLERQDLPEFLQRWTGNISAYPLLFLGGSLFLGILQMCIGMFIGAKLLWDHNQIEEAIEKAVQGVFFLTGAPVMVMVGLLNAKFPAPWHDILTKIALSAGGTFIVLRLISSIRKFKPEGTPVQVATKFVLAIFKAVVSDSVMALVKAITDFLGNMLSYSRLMALGLATGGIGMVVNLLAGLVKDLVPIPVLNVILTIVILILGHIFNLVISSLGAFVHTARLQYVEFFPHFFTGGGRRFEPFSVKTKFTKVVTE